MVADAATVRVGDDHTLFGAVTYPATCNVCADHALLPDAVTDPATVSDCADHVLPGAVTEDPEATESVVALSIAPTPADAVQPFSVRAVTVNRK